VVIAGAGAAGVAAAVAARDLGADVVCVEMNHDVGGHAILSGGFVALGGGTSWQRRYGVEDSADRLFEDYATAAAQSPKFAYLRHADRDLLRVWADESAPTFDFLVENGVRFIDVPPVTMYVLPGRTPRGFHADPDSDDLRQTIVGKGGSGVMRPLERSARRKGVSFLLEHRLRGLVREHPNAGRVVGIEAQAASGTVEIRARRGVVLATGGHTSSVNFRRMFDPRLTEEYQTAGEPWSQQTGDSEILAMEIGAALWGTASQGRGSAAITKTLHIGCRYGYQALRWDPNSPVFEAAGASGLTVADFQDLILVNSQGARIWNEIDDSESFFDACLGSKAAAATNGGGPIWAIFDAEAVRRERWEPQPPNVDPRGWFFEAPSLRELAAAIRNPYQRAPMPPESLESTVARYNGFVDLRVDLDFGKPKPAYRIETPPFYAAWSTPILHDTMTGLRIDTSCRVIDVRGRAIPGLYCAGESAGGFAHHGLSRVLVFGRLAGRAAARADASAIGGRSAADQ
jgi:succinate dehydrogenase/fumarate reductase flavoprotein subunit